MRPKTLKSILKVGRTIRMIFSPVSFVTNHARLKKKKRHCRTQFCYACLEPYFFVSSSSQNQASPPLFVAQTQLLCCLNPSWSFTRTCLLLHVSEISISEAKIQAFSFSLGKLPGSSGKSPQISTAHPVLPGRCPQLASPAANICASKVCVASNCRPGSWSFGPGNHIKQVEFWWWWNQATKS